MSPEPVPPYLRIHDDLEAPLEAGASYAIVAEHEVTGVDTGDYFGKPTTQPFEVRAPQFSLEPADVHALFPPANTGGRYDRSLAHVTLESPILPWQRELLEGDRKTPWLALLLFRPGELRPDPATNSTTVTMTVEELLTHSDSFVRPTLSEAPPADVRGGACQVLTVPRDLLTAILPAVAELRLLAHARQAAQQGPSGESGEGWYATVVGNRLPDARGGVHEAHLVSLEGLAQLFDAAGKPTLPADGTLKPVQMAALASWRFTSAVDSGERFSDLTAHFVAAGAPATLLRIPTPEQPSAGEARAAERLREGYAAVEHRLETGEHSFAWYRGPLTPVAAQPLPPRSDGPLTSSDQALIYVEADGVFDVSYAAAWSAGRGLALADGAFAPALIALRAAARRQIQASAEPGTAEVLSGKLAEQLAPIATWLEELRVLKRVPFAHLVPDEAMLPAESARFFHVDTGWVKALCDGALAVGIQGSFDAEVDGLLREGLGARIPAPPQAGLLLRSTLVSGWPGLVVEARRKGQPVPLLRSELLAPEVRICLFGEAPDAVTLAEPSQGLHFGYEDTEAIELRRLEKPVGEKLGRSFPPSGGFTQFLRSAVSGLGAGVLNVEDGSKNALAAQLAKELGAPVGPAAFALQMIRGAESREFEVGG